MLLIWNSDSVSLSFYTLLKHTHPLSHTRIHTPWHVWQLCLWFYVYPPRKVIQWHPSESRLPGIWRPPRRCCDYEVIFISWPACQQTFWLAVGVHHWSRRIRDFSYQAPFVCQLDVVMTGQHRHPPPHHHHLYQLSIRCPRWNASTNCW